MFAAIVNSPYVHVLHGLSWLPQTLETIHMTFHSLLVGAFLLMALRLLGLGSAISVRSLAKYLLPACWIAVVMQVLSGGLMFVQAADQYAVNFYFLWKIIAVALGIGLLAWIQLAIGRDGGNWDQSGRVPMRIRLIAGAAIPVWFGALVFGRFIYTQL